MFGVTVFLIIMVMKDWVSFWVSKILWIHNNLKNYLCIPQSIVALIYGMCFKETKKIQPNKYLNMDVYMYAQSCPSLCDPMDCNSPGSFVSGIFQVRILEWVAIFYSSDQPHFSCIACIGGQILFTTVPTGKPIWIILEIMWTFQALFGEGNGTQLHYSCLENPMDRGAW